MNLHTPSFNHLEDSYTPPTPSPISGRHNSICLQILSTFVSKIFLKCTKHSHLPSPPPPPPPTLYPLTSTSLNSQFSDQEPHCTSRFLQHHHPPRSVHKSNALTSGSTAYSMIPPSTPTCFIYRTQFKTIPGSLQHLTDRSLLLSEPTAGSAPFSHGQRLATNHGPVFGSSPSSFQAEVYGLLSYFHFLYRIS